MQLPDEKIHCHRTGFQETCFDMVVKKKCQLWIEILGKHPQTDATVSNHVCADAIMPLLVIQGNQLQGQTTASVDKVANEVKEHRSETVTVGAIAVQKAREAVSSAVQESTLQIRNALVQLAANQVSLPQSSAVPLLNAPSVD